MKPLSIEKIADYVSKNIKTFHQKRLESLDGLHLETVLQKKNPYLFKAKNMLTSEQIVRGLVDAHISSNEETLFGNWLEGLAIYINEQVYGGRKSGIPGIDLEFDNDNTRYLVSIKSGPNWGNSSQVKKLVSDFLAAKKTLRTSNSYLKIQAVNGCCYGRDNKPDKKEDYLKLCGQRFWQFISGNENLYTEIIEPLGREAKQRNGDFSTLYHQRINVLTRQFSNEFCDLDGSIDWQRIVELNSSIVKPKKLNTVKNTRTTKLQQQPLSTTDGYRTHNCGELRLSHTGQEVKISGWVQAGRDFGGLTFIDLRDRYGITQLVFNMDDDAALCEKARKLGREFVVSATGKVRERSNKNPNRPTGDIEIEVKELQILNASKTPPFTIEDNSDGGDDLRMKYRYLDIRRTPVQQSLIFRSQVAIETRKHLTGEGFIEIETPNLIKSTPEGARDFVVPSRMNPGQFYALPQSPQTFKQILMVAGMDKYFQIVKCFRDEDLRADRQPEFTQIDCEMAFVTRADVLRTFEALTKHLFQEVLGLRLPDFPLMEYDDALRRFGSDKPDLRFGMEFCELNDLAQGKGFSVFDSAELVVGICAEGQAEAFSNKDLKDLTEWLQRPQIGAKGLVWVKVSDDGTFKSTVSKFYSDDDLRAWAEKMGAKPGDLLLVLCGETEKTRKQLNELRLEMGRRTGLMKPGDFKPLWVINFPLLEWDEEAQRFFAMHHPFTSPLPEDEEKMMSGDHETLKNLKANAYDLVINGVEIGGGSIRIHDRALQEKNFTLLGFTPEQAEAQFGFLLGAFEYGAPPHGGIAFGLDRLCAVMRGQTSIRDFIAFPKNNMGRDVMIDAPSPIDDKQLEELCLEVKTAQPAAT